MVTLTRTQLKVFADKAFNLKGFMSLFVIYEKIEYKDEFLYLYLTYDSKFLKNYKDACNCYFGEDMRREKSGRKFDF